MFICLCVCLSHLTHIRTYKSTHRLTNETKLKSILIHLIWLKVLRNSYTVPYLFCSLLRVSAVSKEIANSSVERVSASTTITGPAGDSCDCWAMRGTAGGVHFTSSCPDWTSSALTSPRRRSAFYAGQKYIYPLVLLLLPMYNLRLVLFVYFLCTLILLDFQCLVFFIPNLISLSNLFEISIFMDF